MAFSLILKTELGSDAMQHTGHSVSGNDLDQSDRQLSEIKDQIERSS
jgi:hypothetical protein